jgi:hypothetical protein
MHALACGWVLLGIVTEDSWVDLLGFREKGNDTLYITAIYWITMTLTTVGYGDVKGNSSDEYLYVMFVQFVGIMFFSFIMGSINSILAKDDYDAYDIYNLKERCDIWLNSLEKSV